MTTQTGSERKTRSLIKAISWRFVAFTVLGLVSFAITEDWKETGLITLVYNLLQIGVYFIHERLWDKITWGKKDAVEQLPHVNDLSPDEVNAIQNRLRQLGYIE